MIGTPYSVDIKSLSDADCDVVKDCFKRLLALRNSGETPHMSDSMDHIYIPYNLGNEEYPFDPTKFHHDPVDYNGFATELKVAA